MSVEPTEVKHVRRRIVDRLMAGGLNESEALMLADSLIAAVRAEALRVPRNEEVAVIASEFHDAYEAAAPKHGYETRVASQVPWEALSHNLQSTMMQATFAGIAAYLRLRGAK